MQMKKYLAIFSLLFILTGCGDSEIAEEKNNEIYQQRANSIADSNVGLYLKSLCIREVSLHVPTKYCIAEMESAGGTWLNDSIMIYNDMAFDITKPYTDEVYYTGELTFTDDNNKRDVLYLIYGHDFSHRVMNYENGKLNNMSSYVDQGGNPVLLEWYEDGVLTFQYSAVHEAKDRGINYGDLCKPAAEPGGWRSCGHIKFSEQEEGVSK